MKIFRSLAVAAAAGAMALGVVGTTAASAAPASTASAPHSLSHPAVLSANRNGSVSAYRPGSGNKLYIQHGPSAWMSNPHFTVWNSHEAVATGALWGSDIGTFSLGHHVTLVFTRVDGNMGYYLFTNLHIKNSHGIVTHWNLRHSASWVPGR